MAQTGKQGRANNNLGSIAATQAYINYATTTDTSSLSDKQLEEQNRQIDVASKNLLNFENAAADVLNNPNTSIEEKEKAKATLAQLGLINDEENQTAEENNKILGLNKSTAYIIIGFVVILIILILIKIAKK